jgi:hypothetical protein
LTTLVEVDHLFDEVMGHGRGRPTASAAGVAVVTLRVEPSPEGSYARCWAFRPSCTGPVYERDYWWGEQQFDLAPGDLLKLVCVQYDSERKKHVNQNWTFWLATGDDADDITFGVPGCAVRVQGAVAVDVNLVCQSVECDFTRPMGPISPDVCPVHGDSLGVSVSEV